ncbi:hypothetical protein EJ06DRAFT_149807 [Trichodelitschia bisporula]|uniref:Uncharacterized protein n=1 Tax=Trichodelitschia bisporula TaxID=703511 RepID=A0A6G1HN13_9PEZI|nr:hypothetical protein EJ06DRAFT_149807 [Trichodelitschia bisporula]
MCWGRRQRDHERRAMNESTDSRLSFCPQSFLACFFSHLGDLYNTEFHFPMLGPELWSVIANVLLALLSCTYYL